MLYIYIKKGNQNNGKLLSFLKYINKNSRLFAWYAVLSDSIGHTQKSNLISENNQSEEQNGYLCIHISGT